MTLPASDQTPSPVSLSSPRPAAATELTIVVPTLNERENVPLLIGKLAAALKGVEWEVIFVDDDSPDGTAGVVRELGLKDPRVRGIQRLGRRGLSSACVEGFLASASPFVAVIDADLQHDERLLPRMLELLRSEALDMVVGSRNIEGGGMGDWSQRRQQISGFAARLSRLIVKADLSDPMSGFFMMRRDAFERSMRQLSGQGFKILLDLFASSPQPLRFKELPYEFRTRQHGESKLDAMVVWEYLMLIFDKMTGHAIPVRFVLFSLVGFLGLGIHLAVLGTTRSLIGFTAAQALATFVAMASNFTLNNLFTYRDRRLTGFSFITGFLSFALVCAVGAVANVGIATAVYNYEKAWWVAGVAGALIGAVWNYAVSSVFTWRKRA